MPLKRGHSMEVVSSNIREMMKAGHGRNQSIAAALSMKRKAKKMAHGGYAEGGSTSPQIDQKKAKQIQDSAMQSGYQPKQWAKNFKEGLGLAEGGMVGSDEEFDDNEDPMTPHRGHNAPRVAPETTSMAEMDREDPEDYISSVEEERLLGTPRENEVANPMEQDEQMMLAKALKKKRDSQLGPESFYAMGGLVQPEHTPNEGNKPEEDMEDSTEEPMDSMTHRGGPVEHRMNIEPSGSELSAEAREAIMARKKSRRYRQVSV